LKKIKLTHGLLLAVFAYLLLPTASIQPIAGLGQEASWHQSLAMALQQKLRFGTDVIFNHGPLGFLDTGFLPEVVHVGARLIFDLYLLCNLLYIIHYCLLKAKVRWLVVTTIVAMFLPWGYIADATFTLLFLFLFNLFHANEHRRSFSLYNAVFIAALMFFVKVNFSLVITILLYASLIYLFATQRFSWRELVAVVITHLFLIYWGAYQLRVDVGEYLQSSIYIIAQYDEAQARILINEKSFKIVIAAALSITLATIVVFFRNAKNVYKRQDYLFTFLMVFAGMYLALKQQFTVLSIRSAMNYFLFIPPLLGLLWIFLRDSGQWFSRLTVIVLLISLLVFQWLRYENSYNTQGYWAGFFPKEYRYFNAKYNGPTNANIPKQPLLDFINIVKMHTPYSYAKSLLYNNFSTYLPKYNLQNRQLPQGVLDKIGDASVDVLPYESSYVFYNKLAYNPRPCLQSQQAVGGYLDQKNVQKLQSKTAPDYVLSQYKPNGLHNLLWQETYTKLSFMGGYTKILAAQIPQYNRYNKLIGNDTLSVYKKKKTAQSFVFKTINKGIIKTNERLHIPKAKNILLLKAQFRHTFLGQLTRYFFQSPYLIVHIHASNGQTWQYKVVEPLWENGVIINKIVQNNADLDKLYTSNETPLTVSSLQFIPKSDWTFVPNITWELVEVGNRP
jgi:hypothetical protein